MGTTVHHQYLRRLRVYTSSSISRLANPHRSESKNVQIHVCLAMRADLTLKRISENSTIAARFQNQRSFCAKTRKAMADGATKNTNPVVISEKKEVDEIKTLPPPPPEKPLPGDCCGSGCVRCVWDVYYEELEAYNKQIKDDSNSESKSKSS